MRKELVSKEEGAGRSVELTYNPVVDIEEVIKEIQRKAKSGEISAEISYNENMSDIAEKNSTETATVLYTTSLQYLNCNYAQPYYWDLGPKGFKTFIKRVIRKLVKFLIAPIAARQELFNAHTVRCFNALQETVEQQSRMIKQLQQQINEK